MKKPVSCGVEMIAAERERQITAPGYSCLIEDRHVNGELGLAAACYAAPEPIYLHECDEAEEFRFINPWPFEATEDFRQVIARALAAAPREGECCRLTPLAWRVRALAKSGALIAAEIDRLLRVGDGSGGLK